LANLYAATPAEQMGYAAFCCALLRMKDESPFGRWMMIGISAAGTVL
jgi:hypothetical protein